MPRPRRNPFYPVLGFVGFLFTITAASSCVSVLRGVRPETAGAAPHPLQQWMDRHGTTALAVELAILAVATVGSIAVDELGHRDVRREIHRQQSRHPGDGPTSGARP
ncbi:MAG: hypothetical protein ACKO4T_10055 [Planctomycetaceae bacterium]